MKILTILSLTLLVTSISYAQLSAKLDSAAFFKSIRFGQIISRDFFKGCSGVDTYASEYRLVYDSLDNNCKKKYEDLFNFYGALFSNVAIETNKGKVFRITVWRLLGATDSVNINNIKYPQPIAKVYNQLVSGFGKPNQVMDKTSPDLINITGLERTISWEGYHTSLWLDVLFGPGTYWHQMRVIITARSFEDMPRQEKRLKIQQ